MLRENDQLAHRGRARPPSASRPKELIAKTPNQIWCWDITYMRAAVRGTFYFLYLVVDVFSRKIVAWTVETEESQDLAVDMIERATPRAGRRGAGRASRGTGTRSARSRSTSVTPSSVPQRRSSTDVLIRGDNFLDTHRVVPHGAWT
ncbi:MAG: DDE-type integrase/transposase/recombinase [Myxococcota bacterium]|nr:DDE-type integrase/transposase/recombinase [Myxococcota bacterium]